VAGSVSAWLDGASVLLCCVAMCSGLCVVVCSDFEIWCGVIVNWAGCGRRASCSQHILRNTLLITYETRNRPCICSVHGPWYMNCCVTPSVMERRCFVGGLLSSGVCCGSCTYIVTIIWVDDKIWRLFSAYTVTPYILLYSHYVLYNMLTAGADVIPEFLL
jgi:hypothetical protein